jgi:long-chain fatty acid transport protein
MFGNGGMNTRYGGNVFAASLPTTLTGVDLNQAFMSVSLSKSFGQFSVGVAPTMAMQLFRANGLGGFSGMSVDPASFSDRSYDLSFGGGVRAGIEYDVTPDLRLGVAGSTKMYMMDFGAYKGLFAGGGSFDIPASVTAGVSYNIRPSITVMFDYKRIFYSDVAAIADPSTNVLLGIPFGASNGSGFGWHDINVYKFAAEWRATPIWTFRAGYSYNDSPLNTRDMMFNILAPATVQHHITGGVKYRYSDNMDLELSAMYAPEGTLSGTTPAAFGGQHVEVRMHQAEVAAGLVYHWNGRQDLESLK